MSNERSLEMDAARYCWLRDRNLDTLTEGGVFAGRTPQNIVLNGSDLDDAIDAAMADHQVVHGCAVEQETDLRPEVLAFARLMERRLRDKDADKGREGWKSKMVSDLTVNVLACGRGLNQAIFPFKGAQSVKALVDMANHCMMLADIAGELEYGKAGPGWVALDQAQVLNSHG